MESNDVKRFCISSEEIRSEFLSSSLNLSKDDFPIVIPENIDEIQDFIEQNKPIENIRFGQETNNNTILHRICSIKLDIEICKVLLKNNGSIHVNTQNIKKETPLHCLLQHSKPSLELIKLLLENNALLDKEDHLKNTPFFT